MSIETETVQETMCSLKSLDKEISFIEKFPEESPSDISGNEAEMERRLNKINVFNVILDFKNFLYFLNISCCRCS